ncbi:SDR family oxidoreductase [Azospirillum sp. YIM B02556]|uniref:SDR family oxidoreductase n=1 Tax=Azospirillum endophyticum TaxID=2800326 RepID=A0ABS1F1D8_9PROT|nr:SDR family oxidoreductase [Azospirillum endophyticum]MBK1837211.1 SDR family oxidoreductase [Azospirillum endophyticum]
MKIVVIGGTGLIGSKLVATLGANGHEVVAASPSRGVNTISGEGLAEVLTGAGVVVDVSNTPSFEEAVVTEFFRTSGSNLAAAEAKAGVRHHVALSIVGTDRIADLGYFRAKVEQERLIAQSGIPYTIVRATQFLEFLAGIADGHADGDTVRLPPVQFQPIAADDVAAILVETALAPPLDGIVDIAGPERDGFAEIVGRYLEAVGDRRKTASDPTARYFGGSVTDRSLVPTGPARLGRIGLKDWLNLSRANA